jgi:hypothetical protein
MRVGWVHEVWRSDGIRLGGIFAYAGIGYRWHGNVIRMGTKVAPRGNEKEKKKIRIARKSHCVLDLYIGMASLRCI